MTNSNERPWLSVAGKEELSAFAKSVGQPAYRAGQIYDWITKKRTVEPDEMKNIPGALREKLKEAFHCGSLRAREEFSAPDGTEKLLLALHDGEEVECAVIPAEDGRITFCLSSQVGCPVSCAFCASGADGLVRNLSAGEIVEEFLLLSKRLGRAPDNVVMMGVGEPLLNFDNLVKALETISNPDGIALAQRRITISTSGWSPGIRALAELGRQWNLAVSLHAPDDKTRALLIPTRFRRDIRDVMEACRKHKEATGRLLTLEYVLLENVNDSPEQARKFARLAADFQAKVNLIPYNKARGAFERPSAEAVKRFENALKTLHVPVTVRVEKGAASSAACGQLRASSRKRKSPLSGGAGVLLLSLAALFSASACSMWSSDDEPPTQAQLELLQAVRTPGMQAAESKIGRANPDFLDSEYGRTPLMYAVIQGEADKVDALLKAGAKVDRRDRNGDTALHYAASGFSEPVLRRLIEAGADINAEGRYGRTPIMEAARIGSLGSVRILAEAGADLKKTDARSRSVMMFAAMAPVHSLQIATYLRERGAESLAFDDEAQSPLLTAIDYRNTPLALALIEEIEQFQKSKTLGGSGSVKTGVFDQYDQVTFMGLLAFRHAVRANDVKVMRLLIEKGLPLNGELNYAYRGMRFLNAGGAFEFLARNGLIDKGQTPVFWAAQEDNLEALQLLVKAGALVTMKDNTGEPPRAYAKSKEVIEYLEEVEKKQTSHPELPQRTRASGR